MTIPIPSHVRQVMARLEAAGHQAWCVGGCVRDCLLGRPPADWDVATSALPQETAACFGDRTLARAGMDYGTIGVEMEAGVVEVTTYRVDGAYSGHRRPEQVAFARCLEEDLARRDFTINAMAYHPERGLADRFGGQRDLKAGLLRCVGDPARRFDEDALRILRALRFGAALGFALDPAAVQAAQEARGLLGGVSGQRVQEELTKLLCGPFAGRTLADYPSLVFAALPELAPLAGCAQESPYHCFDCWGHTVHAVDGVPQEPVLRWAALLHDCGKPSVKSMGPDGRAHFYGHPKISGQIARKLMERLCFSNQRKAAVSALVERHGEPLPMPEKRVKRLLAALGEEGFGRLLLLMRGDVLAQAPGLAQERLGLLAQAEALGGRLLRQGACLTLRDLAVGGGDLLALGLPQGPELGAVLRRLLDEVLAGELANERPVLLARAGEIGGVPIG